MQHYLVMVHSSVPKFLFLSTSSQCNSLCLLFSSWFPVSCSKREVQTSGAFPSFIGSSFLEREVHVDYEYRYGSNGFGLHMRYCTLHLPLSRPSFQVEMLSCVLCSYGNDNRCSKSALSIVETAVSACRRTTTVSQFV